MFDERETEVALPIELVNVSDVDRPADPFEWREVTAELHWDWPGRTLQPFVQISEYPEAGLPAIAAGRSLLLRSSLVMPRRLDRRGQVPLGEYRVRLVKRGLPLVSAWRPLSVRPGGAAGGGS